MVRSSRKAGRVSRKPKGTIAIDISGCGWTGDDWWMGIECRPTRSGFSVWLWSANPMYDYLSAGWHKIASHRGPVDWRTAIESAASGTEDAFSCSFGTLGVSVRGAPEWVSLIARCRLASVECADSSKCNYRAIAELLMGFTDEEAEAAVRKVCPHLKRAPDRNSAPWQALDTIAQEVREVGMEGRTWAEIREKYGLAASVSLVDAAPVLAQGLQEGRTRLNWDKSKFPNCKRWVQNPNSPLFKRGVVVTIPMSTRSAPTLNPDSDLPEGLQTLLDEMPTRLAEQSRLATEESEKTKTRKRLTAKAKCGQG